MEQVVQLNLATPSLLFSAISLILLAYTNRFLAYASVIRNLNNEERTATDAQIANLLKRIKLVRAMQMLGVLSLLSSLMAMFFLYIRLDMLGHIIFGIGMLQLGISLGICVWEIWISTQAIKTHLYQIEKRSRPSNKSTERQQQYADKARSNQKGNGSNGSTPNVNGNRQQQDKAQQNNRGTQQQQTKGQDRSTAQQPSQQNGKQQPAGKTQEKSQDREQGNGKSQQERQERQAQQTTRPQRSQERIENKVPAIVSKTTTALVPVAVASEEKREHTTNPKTEPSTQALSSQDERVRRVDNVQGSSEVSDTPNTMRQGRRNLRTQRSEEAIASDSTQEEIAETPQQSRVRHEQRHERTSNKSPMSESKRDASRDEQETIATVASTTPKVSEEIPQQIRERSPRSGESTAARDKASSNAPDTIQKPVVIEQPRVPKETSETELKVYQEPSVVERSVANTPAETIVATEPQTIPDQRENVEPKTTATEPSETPQIIQTSRVATRNINPARARLPRIAQQPRPARPIASTAKEAPESSTPTETVSVERQSREEGASTEE